MRKTALILLLLAAPAFSITFEELSSIRRIGAPQVSPDGRWIAYDASTIDLGAPPRPRGGRRVAPDHRGNEAGRGAGVVAGREDHRLRLEQGRRREASLALRRRRRPAAPSQVGREPG